MYTTVGREQGIFMGIDFKNSSANIAFRRLYTPNCKLVVDRAEGGSGKYIFIIIIITLLRDNNMPKPYSTIRRLRCSEKSRKSMPYA
jgi:hypothetical protein